MIERRKNKRIKDDVAVVFDQPDHKISDDELHCIDLSLGGMQVVTSHKLDAGQTLTCKLGVLTDVIPLEIQAKVISVCDKSRGTHKEYGANLEFIHNDDLTRERLKDYIKRRIAFVEEKDDDRRP